MPEAGSGRKAQLGRDLVKLAAALVKHQAKVHLGDEAVGILAQEGTTIIGDRVAAKIAGLIDDSDKARSILAAFEIADQCFSAQGSDDLKAAIVAMPLAGLPSLELLARKLPKTLDDASLREGIRSRFEEDWRGRFTDQELDHAAQLYRECLDRSLASTCDQLLPTLMRTTWRIEETTRQNLITSREILSIVQEIQNLLPEPSLAELRAGFDWLLEDYQHLFAGRGPALNFIAEFLANSECEYLVITAPAGFGKTALMANLVQSNPRAFAYHFFAPAIAQSLREGYFLRNVVQQMAQWHGRILSPPDETRLPELSAMYNEEFEFHIDGTRVLVLDGLDELTDWDVARYLRRAPKGCT